MAKTTEQTMIYTIQKAKDWLTRTPQKHGRERRCSSSGTRRFTVKTTRRSYRSHVFNFSFALTLFFLFKHDIIGTIFETWIIYIYVRSKVCFFLSQTSEWVIFSLTPTQQFFSYIMARRRDPLHTRPTRLFGFL